MKEIKVDKVVNDLKKVSLEIKKNPVQVAAGAAIMAGMFLLGRASKKNTKKEGYEL